eukprot:s2134_g11.t1
MHMSHAVACCCFCTVSTSYGRLFWATTLSCDDPCLARHRHCVSAGQCPSKLRHLWAQILHILYLQLATKMNRPDRQSPA